MGHPRTPALYASAAMLAIVLAVLALLRSDKDRPPEPRLPAQAAEPARELNPPPAGRDLDWRAAVQAEPAGAGEPARASADPARAVRVFGFVHTPDGQLAKSVPLQWMREPHSSLKVAFAQPPGSTDPHAEPRSFDVVDGRYEGDVAEGAWIVSVSGQALTDDKKDYAPFAAPVPQLRKLPAGSQTQIDLDFRPVGTCSVRGTIRDEEGKPFGGLAVEISELHVLVDPSTGAEIPLTRPVKVVTSAQADGGFAISALPPGQFRILVEPQGYKPTSPASVGTVGELVESGELVLSDGPMTVELTARRPHPVHVTGRVEVDPAWTAEHGLAGQSPSAELVFSTGSSTIVGMRMPVALTAEGFEFWLDAGVREPRLELTLGSEKFVQPLLLPSAGDLAPLTIRIPR